MDKQEIAIAALCIAQVLELVEQAGGVDRMRDTLLELNRLYDQEKSGAAEKAYPHDDQV